MRVANSHYPWMILLAAALLVATAMPASGEDSADSRGGAMQLLRRARVAMQTGDAAAGQRLVEAALAYSQQTKDPLVEGWGQQLSGELAFSTGDEAAATKAFTAALTAFNQAKDAAGAAGSRVNLGRLQLAAGKSKEALANFQAAQEAYAKLNRPAETAGALSDLAAAERALNRPEAAIEALTKAMELYGKDSGIQSPARLETLFSLGRYLVEQGKLDEAQKPLTEAIALARQVGDRATEAWAHFTLGAALQLGGNGRYYEEAQAEYKAALAIFGSMADADGEANVRNNLGALAREQGQLPQATAEFTKALQLYTQAKNDGGAARALCNLGVVYETEGKIADATSSYEKALALHQKTNDALGSAKILDNLASLSAAQGDAAKARQYQFEAERLRKAN